MTEEDEFGHEGRGLLGEYGVVIVRPEDESGSWFVALTRWDEQSGSYVAQPDGPFLDDREQALAEAAKVLDWLEKLEPGSDVLRLWQEMQQNIGANTVMEREWAQNRGPWGDWNPP